MAHDLPPSFFKYQSRATARIVLESVKLRWSTPATLNDPFDIQFDLATDVDENAVHAMALEKLWRCYIGELEPKPFPGNSMYLVMQLLRQASSKIDRDEFVQFMAPAIRETIALGNEKIPAALAEARQLMSTCKILCLSDTPTNLLLWSHYAEAHQGAALVFAPIENSPYTLAEPVNYVADVPRLFDEELLSDIFAGLRTIDTEASLRNMAFTKSKHWEHEREWRVFAGDGRNKNAPYEDVPFGANELAGIVLGARMPLEDRTQLARLAKSVNPAARIYGAGLTSKFGVVIKEE